MKYFMPQIIFGVSIFSFKGVVSVFGVAYPAGFGSLKTITKCFWSRKVGHINGLFVLEVESGGCIFTCRKNQTNGTKTSTVYSLLKATLPWRWTDAIMISARNIGTTTAAWPRRVLWVRSYARQASTKRRESNGSDVQWRWAHQGTPQNAPRLGFCWTIEQRSLLHFYFTNSG